MQYKASAHFRPPYGAILLNEDAWFERYQDMLVSMANTEFGRALLDMPNVPGRIVYVQKNCIHWLTQPYHPGERVHLKAEFRIGAKWANRIRERWDAFNSYARYFIATPERMGVSPVVVDARAVFASSLVVYPDPNVETTTMDGYVENYYGTWATMRNDTTCQLNRDSDASLGIDEFNGGTSYGFDRSMTLFDTSSLTSGATISATIVELYVTGKYDDRNGGGGGPDKVNCVSATPASNTAIAKADYPNFGTTRFATDIDITGMSLNAYNTWTCVAAGLAAVSKTGVTKFGWRTAGDIDDNAGPNSLYTSGIGTHSADAANDPKMTVTYTLAAAVTEMNLNRTPIRGVMRGVMRP